MRMRAAVLEEFGEPLVGAGGRARRPEARARRWSGWSPAASATPTSTPPRASTRPATRRPCSATRAPGWSRRSGRASTTLAVGDHVVTLFSPQCGECVHCRRRAHQPLPGDPRAAEQGLPARRDDPADARRRGDPPLHGHLDLRRVHGDAGDRAREGQPRGAARPRLPVRLRALDRARRGDQHRQGARGLDLRRLRRRDGRPRRGRRLPPAGRRADHLRRPLARTGSSSPRARARPRR